MPKKAEELGALQVSVITEPGLHAVGGVAGLCLQVEPTGGRSWVLRVMVAGKRRAIGLGGYPDVKLADARTKARAFREAIDEGRDPAEERRAAKARLLAEAGRLLTFEQACRDYLAAHEKTWKHPAHAQAWKHTLLTIACKGMDCGDAGKAEGLGKLSVGDIETTHVLSMLRPLWAAKTETAQRTRQRCEAVLSAAKAGGAIRTPGWNNPFRWKGHLDALLAKPRKVAPIQHQKALPAIEAADFITALRLRRGSAARALEWLVLTACRSNEARGARWAEVDLAAKVWTIPSSRMKGGKEHRVPLSNAAVALVNSLPRLAGTDLLFPGPTGKPLSDVAVSKLCGELSDCRSVPHGWRSTFRDWAGDSTNYPREVAEAALAHVVGGVEGAYRRGDAVERRRPLMADWAAFLAEPPMKNADGEGGNVHRLHTRASIA
jgi:integrase